MGSFSTPLLLSFVVWAPVVFLVPAFGWRSVLSWPVRLSVGFVLAMVEPAPGVREVVGLSEMGSAVLIGWSVSIPVAVGAALVLWAAEMTGDLLDHFEGSAKPREGAPPSGPLGMLFQLLVPLVFLLGGGVIRLAEAMRRGREARLRPVFESVVETALASIELALSVAAPVLIVTIIVDLTLAALSRGRPRLPPALRSVFVLIAIAWLLEAMVARFAAVA